MPSSPFIQTIKILPVSYKLLQPFVTAAGRKTETENVEVILSLSDGTQGLGEASSSIAMPTQSQDNMMRVLKELIPELRERSIGDFRDLIALVWRRCGLFPTAAAAMECALLDAYTRTQKTPLYAFLGDQTISVETDLTLSVADPKALSAMTKKALRKGFRKLKVKLAGGHPAADIERLAAVHKTAPKATLVADGNQGFGLSLAIDFVHRLRRAQIPLLFFEQPFAKHDLRAMRLLRHRTHIPVFADEAVLSAADAVRVLEADAADGINLKVAKSGLLGALDIIQITRRFRKKLAIGCMEESKLGLAASVHLACGTGVFEWVDLDSIFLLKTTTQRGGFHIKGPKLSITGIRAGIGMS